MEGYFVPVSLKTAKNSQEENLLQLHASALADHLSQCKLNDLVLKSSNWPSMGKNIG